MKRHKLVRDKIPQIIRDAGKEPTYHVAEHDAQARWLYHKMVEEADEFLENPCAEEAADVYEVWLAMCAHHGLDVDAVTELASQKRALRGGFGGRVILEVAQ